MDMFLQLDFYFAPFLTNDFWSMNYPQVIFSYNVALANCMIGDFCVIHSGVCIGQDGKAESYGKFSFSVYQKETKTIPFSGTCRVTVTDLLFILHITASVRI